VTFETDEQAGPDPDVSAAELSSRERVLEAAYQLFSRHGTRAVGVDSVIERAGVAKRTLYRHFASKDELVLAFLERRGERWTREWLQAETLARTSDPAMRLLTIFDVFDEWFAQADFEGCSFVSIMLEISNRESPVRVSTVRHLASIRGFVEGLALQAGVLDSDNLARQWHILMKGSIVAAGEGDVDAAKRARQLGALLLAHHGVRVLPG
jgi:AcrR family transcriptional regulator